MANLATQLGFEPTETWHTALSPDQIKTRLKASEEFTSEIVLDTFKTRKHASTWDRNFRPQVFAVLKALETAPTYRASGPENARWRTELQLRFELTPGWRLVALLFVVFGILASVRMAVQGHPLVSPIPIAFFYGYIRLVTWIGRTPTINRLRALLESEPVGHQTSSH